MSEVAIRVNKIIIRINNSILPELIWLLFSSGIVACHHFGGDTTQLLLLWGAFTVIVAIHWASLEKPK